MKKTLLFLAIAVIGIVAFLFYQKKSLYSSVLTRFVPDNTLLLLESNEFGNYPKTPTISHIPLLSRVGNQFLVLKKIGLNDAEIKKILAHKTLYFALIAEAKDDLNFVNYLPLNSDDQFLLDKFETLKNNISGNRIIYHTTQGYKIAEVIDASAKSVFSFIIQDNFLIFSSSSLILEEAILPRGNAWIKGLTDKIHNQSEVVFNATYLNKQAIAKFISTISLEKNSPASQFVHLLSEQLTDFITTKTTLEAKGEAFSSKLFLGQVPAKIGSLNLIPNTSAFVLHFAVSDNKLFEEGVEKYIKKSEHLNDLRNTVIDEFKVDFSKIYQKLQDEIILAGFDEGNATFAGKVLILKNQQLYYPLEEIAKEVAKKRAANVFSLSFGAYTIHSLGIREFPSMAFGEGFAGFDECYFTEYKNHLILTNSLTAMQSYLVTLSKGDVWSNSSKNQAIVKQTSPANLTLIAETNRALTSLKKSFINNWVNKITKEENAINQVEASIYQVMPNESKLYLIKNLSLSQAPLKYTNKWLKLTSIPLISAAKPSYLNNHNKQEIFAQSDDKVLHFIVDNKSVWKHELSGKLIGNVKTVKFLPSNQTQYLVVTTNKAYILSRIQNTFEITEIQNPKSLRLKDFLIFNEEGDANENLTLFAENGESFKISKSSETLKAGFKNNTSNQYITPLSTVILKGTEYAVLLDKKGKLTLQNAKGKTAEGFPVSLNRNINSPAFLEGSGKQIAINILSENGELFKIGISGKIIEKRQLLRPDSETKFFLCPDERNSDWVIMRSDGKNVVVIDKTEKEMFTIKEATFGVKRLKYYNLGIGGKFFALTNAYTNYRFFDEKGEYIGGKAVESIHLPVITYSESYQKLIMNITTPTALETWSVKLR